MRTISQLLLVVTTIALGVAAAPATAFVILLDIDTDSDPNTIETYTEETLVTVKLVLAPTTPGEPIGFVHFGLGGSCRECDQVHQYGTAHDLIDFEQQMWVQAPAFDSGWVYPTLLGCPGNPGYHLGLWFEPVGGGTINLNEPMFLAEFNVWVAPPVPAECDQPPTNLAVGLTQNDFWNYVQLGGPAVEVESITWGGIKAVYR